MEEKAQTIEVVVARHFVVVNRETLNGITTSTTRTTLERGATIKLDKSFAHEVIASHKAFPARSDEAQEILEEVKAKSAAKKS